MRVVRQKKFWGGLENCNAFAYGLLAVFIHVRLGKGLGLFRPSRGRLAALPGRLLLCLIQFLDLLLGTVQ